MAAFTTLQQSTLVQLYVGILGTTPTTAALNTYATIFASTSGSDAAKYDAVAAAMVASTAGQTKYPVFATAGQIADTMLGHLGLSGSAVGADGTTLKALAEGILAYPGVTVASFGRALLNALNTNTFTGTDQLSVAAAAAKAAYGVNTTTGAAGATLKTAVDTALGITPPVVDPVSKVFTTALDSLEGGAGNDTFTGTVRATSSQVESGDQVTGGAGTDTVAIKMADKGGGSLDVKLIGVENISLEMYSSLAMSGIDWSGVKKVAMEGPAGNLTLTDLPGPIDLDLTGKDYGQNPSDRDLTATFRGLSGGSDALSLSITNLTGVSAEINQSTSEGVFETVAVSLTQSGSGATFGVFGSAFSGSTSLSVTGTDNEKMTLNLSSGQKVGNVTLTNTGSGSTVNISVGATGSADQTVSFAAAGAPTTYTIGQEGGKSITGSTFNDSITLSSTGSGTVSASLGGGNDTIVINSLPVGATGGHSVDGGDGNDTITIASNRNATVLGGDGADTISSTSTGSGNLVITAGSGADVLTITLAGQHSVDMGAGADTITASSAVSADDTIDGGADADYMSFSLAVQTTSPKISNVETLGVAFSTTGSRRLVGTDINGATEIRSTGSGANAGQVYMTGMSGNMTLNFLEGAATGTNTVAFKDGADVTLTLKGTGAAASTQFDVSNVQTLIVSTNSSGASNNWGSGGAVKLSIDSDDTDYVTIAGYGSASHVFDLARSSAVQSYTISHNGSGSTTVNATAGSVLLSNLSITSTASANVTFAGMTSASGLTSLSITAGEQSTITVGGVSGNNAFNAPNTSISVASASTVVLGEFNYNSFLEQSLTITSTGSGTNSIQFGTANSLLNDFYTTVTLTGDAALKMGSGGAAGGLTSMSASMSITTGSGADILLGGTEADTINSGAGNDSVFGGSGDDVINPGLGSDQIVPGHGSDTIRMNNGSYTGADLDRVSGFGTTDIIDYSASTAVTKQTAAVYTMAAAGTAVQNLFAASSGYEIWRYSGAQAYAVGGASGLASGFIDFKSSTGFNLLFAGSGNGTVDGYTSMFASATFATSIDGASGYGVGFTGSAASALLLFEAAYSATTANGINDAGPATGTYVIAINYTGSGGTTLSTANIVSQMFLAGVTGLAHGNFG